MQTAVDGGAMTKNIEAVSPRIGQRGTTVEVTLLGVSIEKPREVIFFGPGIRAYDIRTAATPPPQRNLAHGGRIAEAVVCTFEIAADCPLGEHPFRLLTATELTCIGTFHVTAFAVKDENETASNANDTLSTAMDVAANVTVRGVMSSWGRSDVDLYRVMVQAGQHLSVDVESARLADVHYGDSEYDLALRILDDQGKAIAVNDDNAFQVQDPMLSLLAPRDGHLYVEVSRSVFMGRDTEYCVHIGNHPRPLLAYPPGGPIGNSQAMQLIGDPAGPLEVQLRLPEEEGWFLYAGDGPTSVRIRCRGFPNLLEAVTEEETTVTQIPVALNGIIDRQDDRDRYRLTAKKGEPWLIRTFSAALGSPLDLRLRLFPLGPDGRVGPAEVELDDARLEQRDVFGTAYRGGGGRQEILDPSILWEPQADGQYLLEISDSSGSGGPLGIYRIEIEPPVTVVQTLLASRTFDWTESMRVSGMVVPRGNRWTVNVTLPAGQWKSLGCDFDLVAHGLPPGVTMTTPRLKPGTTYWPLQFTAQPSAALGGAVISLEAIPVDRAIEVQTRCQQNVPFINHSGGDAWHAVQVDKYIVGVTDPAPFSLDIEQPTIALVRGGELGIPVRITRHGDFQGPVEFSVGYIHGAIEFPPPTIIPAGQNEGLLTLSAQPSAPLGVSPLVVVGSTMHETIDPFLGAGHIRVSSQIVELAVSQPYLELSSQPSSIRRGEQKRFVWSVTQKTPFSGEAHVRLLGLPKGVTVLDPAPRLTKDSTEIAFQIEATDEALLGQVSGLSCEVIVPVDNQQITQRTGRGSLRIDPSLSGS